MNILKRHAKKISNILILMFFSSIIFSGCSEWKKPIPVTSIKTESQKEYWPAEDWRTSSPEQQGIDSQKLYELVKEIKDTNAPVDSMLIIRNGYLVTEAYFNNTEVDTTNDIQSCTKSVVSILTGIAIDEGKIENVNKNVMNYFNDLHIQNVDSDKRSMTIKHLLTMTTGLNWPELQKSFTDADNPMVGMFKSKNPFEYVLSTPMDSKPGEKFNYCSGASHLLSGIIKKSVNENAYLYAKEKLFKPLGITDAFWDTDVNKCSTGMGGLSMSSRDMAKIGYLYLRNGKWNGKQIVSQKWVEESTEKQIENIANESNGYGYQWWMDSFGGYSARGVGGQFILVMPDLDMVIVFQGDFPENTRDTPLGYAKNSIIPAAISQKPLPINSKAFEALKSICN
jgi:CubicO group peptidase (beta-lactamase class C family)